MRASDLDGNGYIDYAEFRAATIWLFRDDLISPLIDQAFNFFDKKEWECIFPEDFLQSLNTTK